MDWLAVAIGALTGAVTTLVGVYIAYRKLRPEIRVIEASADKTDAETTEIISRTLTGVISELRKDLDVARSEIASLKAAHLAMVVQIEERDLQRDKDRRLIRLLQRQVAALRAQLAELGHDPYKVTNGDDQDQES